MDDIVLLQIDEYDEFQAALYDLGYGAITREEYEERCEKIRIKYAALFAAAKE